MGRRVALVALVVIAALGLWKVLPFLTEKRAVVASTATPTPLVAANPLALAPGSEVCLDQVTFVPDGEVAQFAVADGPPKGPSLGLTMDAPGFERRVRVPAGYPIGPVGVRVPTPERSVIGRFCIRNLGRVPITLLGTTEGRLVSRPQTTVDGQPNGIKVSLRFEELEPRSLVARIPEIFRHAATFKPLSVWMVWALALLALLALPAGVLWALAGAASAPAAPLPPASAPPPGASPAPAVPPPPPGYAPAPDPRPAAPAVPFPRGRAAAARGARRVRDASLAVDARWLFAAVLAVGVIYLAYWATRVRGFQNDEYEYVYLARWTNAYFPESLWDFTTMTRGLQRLEVWLLALPISLLDQPWAFRVAHVLNVLAFVSSAIPAYLLARGLGLAPRWRALAALLVVALPWAVVSVTFLTEPLAYPAFVWSFWAIWRAAVHGGWRNDLLALALIGVASLSRTSLALLAPLLLLTVAWQELRCGDWRSAHRRHALLVGAVLGVALYLLLAGGRSLAGGYGLPFFGISRQFLNKTAYYLAHLVTGVGFFPFVIGAPWLLARLLRPRDAARHALAVAGVLTFLLVLYVNSPAGTDERYVIYLAPPLVLAFCAALARRDLAWPMALLGGAGAIWLLHHFGWNAEGGAYGFFIGPAETFYARIWLLNIQTALSLNPGPAIFFAQVLATLFAAWVLTRGAGALRAGAFLVAFVVVLQLAQTHYNVSNFVSQGMHAEPGQGQRAWIDQAVDGGAEAAIWADGQGNTLLYSPVWFEAEYWNDRLTAVVSPSEIGIQVPRDDVSRRVDVSQATGYVKTDARLPDYAVVPADGRTRLVGEVVAKAGYIPAELIHVDRPWRRPWIVAGFSGDGYLAPGATGGIRAYAGGVPDGVSDPCLQVDLLAPAGFHGSARLAAGSTTRKADVDESSLTRMLIPLAALARGAGHEDLTLSARGGPATLADGREVTVQLGALEIRRC